MEKPILVFKVGTASITTADGTPDVSLIASFARQIAQEKPRQQLEIQFLLINMPMHLHHLIFQSHKVCLSVCIFPTELNFYS